MGVSSDLMGVSSEETPVITEETPVITEETRQNTRAASRRRLRRDTSTAPDLRAGAPTPPTF